jgi:hypothetical protein
MGVSDQLLVCTALLPGTHCYRGWAGPKESKDLLIQNKYVCFGVNIPNLPKSWIPLFCEVIDGCLTLDIIMFHFIVSLFIPCSGSNKAIIRCTCCATSLSLQPLYKSTINKTVIKH